MSFSFAKINKDNAICVCKLEEQQHNVLLHLQKSTRCKHQQQNNLNYILKDQQNNNRISRRSLKGEDKCIEQ
jgi:hypothetical protein